MELQRRLEYGFNGYQAPAVPRASRSARARVPIRKKHEENQKHAFEILATVAGKFLLDVESNAACGENQCNIVSDIVGHEQGDEVKFSEADHGEHAICKEKSFSDVNSAQEPQQSCTLNDYFGAKDNFSFKSTLTLKNHDQSEEICFADDLANLSNRDARSPFVKVPGDTFSCCESNKVQVKDVSEIKLEAEPSFIRGIESGTLLVSGSMDKLGLDRSLPSLVNSESHIEASMCGDWLALAPPGHCANMQVVSRDDDENFTGCMQIGNGVKAYSTQPDSVDQRNRNLSASRYWRAPNSMSGAYCKSSKCLFYGLTDAGGKRKPFYHNGRTCHTHQRSRRTSFKRRKFFNRSPLSKSPWFSSDKGSNGDNYGSAVRASSLIEGQGAPPEARDCNVKLSIKSFKVPELFIEIPVTATVDTLKRRVMEAMSAILGDGLHVGILLQGKKVRDDSKTLLQTGISQDKKHSSLGFMLEPGDALPPLCSKDHLPTGRTTSLTVQQGTSGVSPILPVMNLNSCAQRKLRIHASHADISMDNAMPDSRSLVAVPPIGMQTLAVVPLRRRSGHSEFLQRRVRRPFSVSEVEALVQAVEKLGTGRWRDVKLCAFDNAKHRTYVDLKDKWKTLVHTARISPQQRRGEPVPQELLDRVLDAHAYWSQQLAKHQIKAALL